MLIRDCTSIKNIYVAYMSSSQIFVYIISTNTIVHMANFKVIHHVQLNFSAPASYSLS